MLEDNKSIYIIIQGLTNTTLQYKNNTVSLSWFLPGITVALALLAFSTSAYNTPFKRLLFCFSTKINKLNMLKSWPDTVFLLDSSQLTLASLAT